MIWRIGQCLLQDLYGRVGVVQIHPVFEEPLHAFDTRPPVQRNEVSDEKERIKVRAQTRRFSTFSKWLCLS
ncbi:MAG: ATP-binding protein [Blautia massiliensis (ex Durand et al. 2017)]